MPVRRTSSIRRTPVKFRQHISKRQPVTIRKAISLTSSKQCYPMYLNKEALLEQFTPLIRSIYKLFSSYNGIFVQNADYEDLYAQICFEFIRLCDEYDPTRGVDFPGYIKFHLQNRVYHFVTKEQRRNNREQPVRVNRYSDDDESMLNMENYEELIDVETIRQFEKVEALSSLNWDAVVGKKHRALIEGVLYRGKTLEELAEEEGVTMKVMRLRLHFACKRLSDYAEEQKAYEEFQKSIVRTPIKLYLF